MLKLTLTAATESSDQMLKLVLTAAAASWGRMFRPEHVSRHADSRAGRVQGLVHAGVQRACWQPVRAGGGRAL